MKRLEALLSESNKNYGRWVRGRIPVHYKRLNISNAEADRLAKIGASQLMAAFEMMPYYTQSVIAGAILSGDYDTITAVTPSQYGKSYLLGHVALLLAYEGHPVSVGAAKNDTTDIILRHTRASAREAAPEIKAALTGEATRKVDRLEQSLSRSRIGFAAGGYVEALTLGGTFDDLSHNKAVGRGSDFIIDEAALVPESSMAEIGRREFSSVDGSKKLLVMISNPHAAGTFYDHLTDPHPPERTLIVWADALTACQEDRWSPKQVLSSDFAKHEDTRTRYLLCELPRAGSGMFGDLKVGEREPSERAVHFLGVDAAYKGKDSIAVCDVFLDEGMLHISEIARIKKPVWIDGVTSEDIADTIARIYHRLGAMLVCVDIGFGVWLVEGLARRGVNVRGINFGEGPTKARVKARHYAATNASNMRAEMHLDFQSLIESEKIDIEPNAHELIKDTLPLVVSQRKASGKIQIRPKAEVKAIIGRSPDELDAVLLAVHSWVLYSGEYEDYIT